MANNYKKWKIIQTGLDRYEAHLRWCTAICSNGEVGNPSGYYMSAYRFNSIEQAKLHIQEQYWKKAFQIKYKKRKIEI